MTDSKHTPGPWTTEYENTHGAVNYSIHPPTAKKIEDGIARGRVYTRPLAYSIKEEANARLIAAAPDLLEACENIENDGGQVPEHVWKMIQAAIAKATGDTT